MTASRAGKGRLRGDAMSWQTIADTLAERLLNHAYCPEGHTDPWAHKDCPFCDDIRAMVLYREKGGTVRAWELPADARSVPIEELMNRDSHEPDNPQGVWCCDEHRRQYQKVSTPPPAESKVEDLMAALEQSVKEARHGR